MDELPEDVAFGCHYTTSNSSTNIELLLFFGTHNVRKVYHNITSNAIVMISQRGCDDHLYEMITTHFITPSDRCKYAPLSDSFVAMNSDIEVLL